MLLKQKPKYDSVTGFYFYDDNWGKTLEKYRDKLVALGYLQKKEFNLKTITNPSLEFRRLWEELGEKFPNYPFVLGMNYNSDNFAMIVVWDRPKNLPEWERIILAHDSPVTDIVDVSKLEKSGDIIPFLGSWGTEEGDVCYIIFKDIDGNVKIETPPDKIWRTVLKNVSFDGGEILFDSFIYTDTNDTYKSIVDNSGEHLASGIRIEIALEVNPKDSNELLITGTSVFKGGRFSDSGRYVLKRIK